MPSAIMCPEKLEREMNQVCFCVFLLLLHHLSDEEVSGLSTHTDRQPKTLKISRGFYRQMERKKRKEKGRVDIQRVRKSEEEGG